MVRGETVNPSSCGGDSISALALLRDCPMIYVMIVKTNVINEEDVNDEKKKETAERSISIRIMKKIDRPIRGQEKRVKYAAIEIFRRARAPSAKKLNTPVVTVIRRTIPKNLPMMY